MCMVIFPGMLIPVVFPPVMFMFIFPAVELPLVLLLCAKIGAANPATKVTVATIAMIAIKFNLDM